jgi:hypothetical protein
MTISTNIIHSDRSRGIHVFVYLGLGLDVCPLDQEGLDRLEMASQ